jgi:hypothetical protein
MLMARRAQEFGHLGDGLLQLIDAEWLCADFLQVHIMATALI